MAQKKLNKNLVAFLTVMGILLTVAIAGLVTYQGAQRDPEIFAQRARTLEASGEFERAIDLYLRAYDAAKTKQPVDVTHLVEASRCAYQIGEITKSLDMLRLANTQRPDDMDVVKTLLDRLWELRDYYGGDQLYIQLRDYSDELLKQEPENVLALLCRSEALQQLSPNDAAAQQESEVRLARAEELGRTDPRVATTFARRLFQKAAQLRARAGGTPSGDAQQEIQKLELETLELLEAATAANPGHARLNIALAEIRYSRKEFDQARDVLRGALDKNPKDAELLVAYGRFLAMQADAPTLKDQPAERRKLLDEASAQFLQASRIEPALYETYADLAKQKLANVDPQADPQQDLVRRFNEALTIYEDAVKSTVGLRSLRAALGAGARVAMLFEAFTAARQFQVNATDPQVQKSALQRATLFLDEAKARYPDAPVTHVMDGELASAQGDWPRAIKAYQLAEERSRGEALMFNRVACEQLTQLLRRTNELGAALKFSEQAMLSYTRARQSPPLWLIINQAQLLLRLDRPDDALQLARQVQGDDAKDPQLITTIADALGRLGRPEEAERLVKANTANPDSPDALLAQARLAAAREEYGAAEALLRQLLEKEPQRLDFVRAYVGTAMRTEQRAAAREFLRSLAARVTSEETKRVYATYDLALSDLPQEQRDAEFLKIIQTIPDEGARNRELYNYYSNANKPDQAAPYLDQLEAAAPNDKAILEEQFLFALRTNKLDRAQTYVGKLAALNADLANGAVYRGQLAMSKQDYDGAIREFSAAIGALPNDSNLRVNHAMALLGAKGGARVDEAVRTLQDAVEINPRNLIAHKLLYQIFEQTGRQADGLPHLAAAEKISPQDPFVQQKANILQDEVDPPAAIVRREALRKSEPNNVSNLAKLGTLYGRVGDHPHAEEAFAAAQQLEPANEEAAQAAGQYFVDREDRASAERALRTYIDATQGAAKQRGYLGLGRMYELLKDVPAARAAYDQAIQILDQAIPDVAERRRLKLETTVSQIDFLSRVNLVDDAIAACRAMMKDLGGEEDRAYVQRARLRIIDLLLRADRLEDADREIAAYTQQFPRDVRAVMSKAATELKRKDWDAARATLTTVLQERPDDGWALCNRGIANTQTRRYTEAREDLTKAKQVTGADGSSPLSDLGVQVRYQLASLYHLTGSPQLAESTLREILDRNEFDTGAASRLINLYRAMAQLDKAQTVIGEYMTRYPKSAFWPYQLGVLLMERDDAANAATHFETAVERSKRQNPEIIATWLNAMIRAKRPSDAVKAYESLDRTQLSPTAVFNAGVAYQATKNAPQAEQLFEQALQMAGERHVIAVRAVASSLVKVLPVDDSITMVRRVADAAGADSPVAARLRIVLATVLMDLDRIKEGLDLLDSVEKAAPREFPDRVSLLLAKARGLYLLKDVEGTIKLYQAVLQIESDNSDALNNLAYFLAESKRPAEALQYAELAARERPEDANVLDTLGWAYFINNRMEDAETQLRNALRLEPFNPAALYHLGEVMEATRRLSESNALFRQALDAAQKQRNAEFVSKAQEKLKSTP